jgi:hypothetical protein
MAIVLVLKGRPADGSVEANAAIALAERARDRGVEAEAWRVAGQLLQYRGQWDSALTALRRSEALYLATRNRTAIASSLIWQAQVLGGMGRYGEMRKVMQRALAEGDASHNPDAAADAYRVWRAGQHVRRWPGAGDNFRRSAATSIALGDSSSARTEIPGEGGDGCRRRHTASGLLSSNRWAERTNYPRRFSKASAPSPTSRS